MTTPSSSVARVQFTNPNGPEVKTAEVLPSVTGREAIAALVEARFLPPETPRNLYALALKRGEGKPAELRLEKPLAAQGVGDGSTVIVSTMNEGA